MTDIFPPISAELREYLDELNKETSDCLYGHLFEPQMLMQYAVSLEHPELAAKGREIFEKCETILIPRMEEQVAYYRQHVPLDSQSRQRVELFNTILSAYVAEHCGQFIPKKLPK